MVRGTIILTALLMPAIGLADTLSTTTANNGSGGIFMDLTSAGLALTVTSFDLYLGGSAGTPGSVEVYTRSGSYVGFDGSSLGWTLAETVAVVSNGSTTLAPLTLSTGISIGASQTLAVYLHSITSGNGIRYNGTSGSPPQTTWSDANLTLYSEHARTGNVPFGGTLFTPRTFAGNVNYDVEQVGGEIPEPASVALFGAGLAALGFLRRKRA